MTLKRTFTLIAAAGLAAALYYYYGGHQTPEGQPPLASFSLPSFQEAFNGDATSDVRVVLMFSPT